MVVKCHVELYMILSFGKILTSFPVPGTGTVRYGTDDSSLYFFSFFLIFFVTSYRRCRKSERKQGSYYHTKINNCKAKHWIVSRRPNIFAWQVAASELVDIAGLRVRPVRVRSSDKEPAAAQVKVQVQNQVPTHRFSRREGWRSIARLWEILIWMLLFVRGGCGGTSRLLWSVLDRQRGNRISEARCYSDTTVTHHFDYRQCPSRPFQLCWAKFEGC